MDRNGSNDFSLDLIWYHDELAAMFADDYASSGGRVEVTLATESQNMLDVFQVKTSYLSSVS